ncbi:MAG: sulfurtransferase TusA family protein [Candidatus Hodarchaeota archaeon]
MKKSLNNGSGEENIKVDHKLDVRGLNCPVPLLKTRREIMRIEIGQILEVLSTDKGSKLDIPSWAEVTGHEIIAMKDEGDFVRIYVKRKR